MAPWIKRWQLREMFAGVAEVGAEDAWWETALDLEELHLKGKQYSGGGVDVCKCFDQIVRHTGLRGPPACQARSSAPVADIRKDFLPETQLRVG